MTRSIPTAEELDGFDPTFTPSEPLSLRAQLEAQYRRPQPRPNEVTPALAKYLDHLEARIEYLERRDPEAHLPEECRKHECDYYTHYLAYGGPDLTHEGYHAAAKLADQHISSCTRIERGPCPVCQQWERRVRA